MSKLKGISPKYRLLFEDLLAEQTITLKDCLVFEQELFDALPIPIFFNDADGFYLGANLALADFLGVEREKLAELGVYHFLAPGRAAKYQQRDAELLTRGGRESFEGTIANADGQERAVIFTRATVHNGEGRVTGLVVTLFDISEKMKLEKQLRHSQKMEAIGALAGGIAHDFNNVLTPIMGQAEIMRFRMRQNGWQHPELEDSLSKIMLAAKRAKELVDQILTFARSQEQSSVAIYLHPVIKEVLGLIKVALPSTIQIRQEIDTDCGRVVMDSIQLHQVLMNLCTNSFHALEGRVGVLTVRLAKDKEEPGGQRWVVLSVEDTGAGIEPAVLSRIFEPYFTTKDKSRGTGMGLAMVHGIVITHGGRVEVQSELGVGTTFTIYLPVAADEPSPVESVLATPLPVGGHERILVVDDDEQVVDVVTSILQGLGYKVTSSISAQEALLLFMEANYDFDLVLTDYTMPLMTGLDLCARIRKIRPDIPLILSSGGTEQITEESLRRAGINEYLPKPITFQGLAQVVRRALDQLRI